MTPVPASTTLPSTPKPAAPAPAASLPPGALAFYPTDELALRTAPRMAPDTLIRRVPVTEQLVSVENAKIVIPKVGVVNQWLKVRDASGRDGYVAAWYVKYAGGSTAQQTAVAAPAPGATKVRTAAQAVAFRKQPVVNQANLIRWLPLGTEMTLAEPGAEGKIGANNQWLKVKDTAGMEGYVAAWFVSR
jgi:SH3-like domain-containing protein